MPGAQPDRAGGLSDAVSLLAGPYQSHQSHTPQQPQDRISG